MRRTSLGAVSALVAGALVAGALVAGAALTTPAGAGPTVVPDRRVLVLSLPELTWEDVNALAPPNLLRLLDDSAVADLATRPVAHRSTLADGYTTLNAGTRAVGAGSSVDGQSFGVGERYGADTAAEVFARRTGEGVDAGIVAFALPEVERRNADEPYDAEVGALGDALATAGYSRAVISNADGEDRSLLDEGTGPAARYRRFAVEGLMGSDGVVPTGTVGPELLEADAAAPFGLRYDVDAVVDAFTDVWAAGSVVLVEASDLVRESAYRGLAEGSERARLFEEAVAATDALVGRLLGEVDLERDVVLVVGPTHPRSEVRLTIAALHAPGVDPGLLRSASTRRPGFVELVDVAPTILDQLGIDRPDSMEGRAMEVGEQGGSPTDRRTFLADADADATAREERVGPVAFTFIVLVGLVLAAGVLAVRTGPSVRLVALLRWAALVALAFVPSVLLGQLLAVRRSSTLVFLALVLALSVGLAAAFGLLGRRDTQRALVLALAAIVVVLLVDVVAGAPMQFNGPLGYSPKVGGRFTGFGNLGYAALTSAALLLAGLVCHRVGGRRGILLATVILVAVFLADAAPFWGADVGGTLSVFPAYAVTVFVLLDRRVRVRTAVLCGLGAVGTVVALGLVDLARPSSDRSHLGRLFERITDNGWTALSNVIERKIGLNLATLTSSIWVLAVLMVIGFTIWLVRTHRELVERLDREIPEGRATTLGFATLLVLGYALNDSGIAVPGLMLGIFAAVVVPLAGSGSLGGGDTPPPPSGSFASPVLARSAHSPSRDGSSP